jgi:hypothetical protein
MSHSPTNEGLASNQLPTDANIDPELASLPAPAHTTQSNEHTPVPPSTSDLNSANQPDLHGDSQSVNAEQDININGHLDVASNSLASLANPPMATRRSTDLELSHSLYPAASGSTSSGGGLLSSITASIASAPNPRPSDFNYSVINDEEATLDSADIDAIGPDGAPPGSPTARLLKATAPHNAAQPDSRWNSVSVILKCKQIHATRQVAVPTLVYKSHLPRPFLIDKRLQLIL